MISTVLPLQEEKIAHLVENVFTEYFANIHRIMIRKFQDDAERLLKLKCKSLASDHGIVCA